MLYPNKNCAGTSPIIKTLDLLTLGTIFIRQCTAPQWTTK